MPTEILNLFDEIKDIFSAEDRIIHRLNTEIHAASGDITNTILCRWKSNEITAHKYNGDEASPLLKPPDTPENSEYEPNIESPMQKHDDVCNHAPFIQDLLQIIFNLHEKARSTTDASSDLTEGKRNQIHAHVKSIINQSAEKVKKISEIARKRQVYYEEESAKTIHELQEQRRLLMLKLNEADLKTRESVRHSNLMAMRIKSLENQLQSLMKTIENPMLYVESTFSNTKIQT